MAPERAVRALDTHSPTVTVNAGFRDEARTMSGLSPVARMERPMRVFRNVSSSTPARTVTEAASSNSYQSPPMPLSRRRVKIGAAAQQALVGLPAHRHQIDGVQARVGDDARQNGGNPQASLQKSGDESGARCPPASRRRWRGSGVPPAASVTETAAPRTKQPSVVISAMFKDPVAQKQRHARPERIKSPAPGRSA